MRREVLAALLPRLLTHLDITKQPGLGIGLRCLCQQRGPNFADISTLQTFDFGLAGRGVKRGARTEHTLTGRNSLWVAALRAQTRRPG